MLTIAACASLSQVLGDAPADLRTPLRAATGAQHRRINRFIELALLGAQACRARAGAIATDAAVYLGCDTSTLADSSKILAGWIDERRPPAPFDFINVSSNMAGFYVAQLLGLDAPQLALHRNGASFEAALELAQVAHCCHRRALVGYVEEGVWPLAEQRARLSWEGPIAECSHWVYVDADAPQPLGFIERVERCADLDAALRAFAGIDGCVLGLGPGWSGEERAHAAGVLGMPIQPAPLARDVWSGGRAAQALCAFLEAPAARHWLHLARGETGEAYALLARAAAPG